MYHTISEFIAEWTSESESTLKVLSALTDASLSQKVSPDGRSLGSLAWHLVQTLGEMGTQAGLKFSASVEKAPIPDTAGKIVSTYRSVAVALGNSVKASWSDAGLAEEIEMYGEKWTRSKALSSLIVHEIHHRAQMTVLMRQAGLKVPGVYGPAKEEWAQYNMKAPE
ncbi:MAG: DinB family protein [Ignavibacteriales bacterium]|nr:DinB family protein [Ignavibacteriales bacterium]